MLIQSQDRLSCILTIGRFVIFVRSKTLCVIWETDMTEVTAFPDTQLDAIREAFERGGAEGVIVFISQFETIDERKALYGAARRVILKRGEQNLDTVVTLIQKAIADCISASEAEPDPQLAAKIKDTANIFSYNLSADMAECWPEDHNPRSPHHFEIGLAAAEDCLRWRHELKKGPWPFSIAWWAKGVHQLSLGRAAEAVESFHQSYHHAELVAVGAQKDAATDFGCVLAIGYLSLAKIAAGDPAGAAEFESACDTFRTVAAGEPGEAADDAEFGLAQLETMHDRLKARGAI